MSSRCGTYSAYTEGCRCDACRAAAARYQRQRRAKAGGQRGISLRCWLCDEYFATPFGLTVHQGRRH